MDAVGLIVEYNPFHNGHQWHVQQAKKLSGCTAAIGVMSGNFVQRGEPAIFDKWTRAEMAVKGGVDLVLELPVMFTVRSAQYFAAGAVKLLNSLGIVNFICFGSEDANQEQFEKIILTTEQSSFKEKLHMQLRKGYPYAAAFGKTIQIECGVDSSIVSSPNNILALEYLRAIRRYSSNQVPILIKRHQSSFHERKITNSFASATAIREAILSEISTEKRKISTALPLTSYEIILSRLNEKRGPVTMNSFSNIALYKLRCLSTDDLQHLSGVNEGLENKIYDCALKAGTIEEFYQLLKNKRYTRTRLQRIVIHALLDLTDSEINWADNMGPLYARILALNQQGRKVLKSLARTSHIPVINKTTTFLNSNHLRYCRKKLTPLQKMLAKDILASDVYNIGLPMHRWVSGGLDFRQSPIYIPFLPE